MTTDARSRLADLYSRADEGQIRTWRDLQQWREESLPPQAREILGRKKWETRAELAQAIFEWIEGFYNPERRHSSIDYHSPIDYEQRHTPTQAVA